MRDGSADVEDGPDETFARGGRTSAAYRGFLFADLRGFTAFVESRGESAAAGLLDAYRSLVREQVGQHAGAEIRTEGDSFYVVFPSARAAVACGLGITAAAALNSEQNADRPIRVGIGINAGETMQHGEGFVGTAVNLAARVCSQARAGEVLVTVTVREAVRGASDLRFVFRGSRRLKGIAQSVPLFAVEAAGAPTPRSVGGWLATQRPGRGAAVAGLLAAAAIVIALGLAVRGGLLSGPRDDSLAGASPPTSAPSGQANPLTSGATGVVGTAVPTPDAYPNPEESALLASVDADVAHCERADLDDRPRLSIDPEHAEVFGVGTTRPPLAIRAGVSCTIPSAAAPSSLDYWSAGQMLDYTATYVPEALILSDAGTFDVPRGDCAVATPAFGRWSFGDSEGWLLCRDLSGDALVEWTYDGRPTVGVASRRDGDHAKLYAWWRANARFLNE
jgi:class 3 adenylate cyclase